MDYSIYKIFQIYYRWMCGIKLQDRVPSKGLRERLGLDDIISVPHKTGCGGMGMGVCCKKKTM